METEDLITIIENAANSNKTHLDLSNRDIMVIPDEISRLKSLKKLNLSYNSISNIPLCICELPNLKELRLSRNLITKLPENFGQLRSLITVDISHNPLIELPESIGDLQELDNLDISFCKLERLPFAFIRLLSLRNLSLEHNSFIFPPEKVIKRGLYATMHYLTEAKKRKETKLINVQVFNLSAEIHNSFRQYVEFFRDIVGYTNGEQLNFDVNFINQNIGEKLSLMNDIDDYFYDFLKFVKENISVFKNENQKKKSVSIVDLQVLELRKQIEKLDESLTSKQEDIKQIQMQLHDILKIMKH